MIACLKCGGCLEVTDNLEADASACLHLAMARCLNCGRREDLATLQNRLLPQPARRDPIRSARGSLHQVQLVSGTPQASDLD
jgi:hypothetical protein